MRKYATFLEIFGMLMVVTGMSGADTPGNEIYFVYAIIMLGFLLTYYGIRLEKFNKYKRRKKWRTLKRLG